ncbi:MAG: hypothetical protein Q9225_002713 [Loekoesia sp. 1 TL-2023]
MTSNHMLTRLRKPLQSLPYEADMKEGVQAAINELSARTRKQVSAVKQNAMEAGILAPEMQPSASTINPRLNAAAEDWDDESEAGPFRRVPKPKNPWPEISGSASLQLWLVWDNLQDRVIGISESPQYAPGSGLPPYPDLLKDLYSRQDDEDDDASARTFEPQVKHFQEFDVLLAILQEYGKGRNVGFVKIEVPEEALPTPVDAEHNPGEVTVVSHRCRLDSAHKHPHFDTEGIYCVKRSTTSNEETVVIWRMIMDDIDRVTLRDEATDQLRNKLRLKDPHLTALKGNILANLFPSSKIHLAGNAGVTRPLRASPIGAYSTYYLHRGAPVTWTVLNLRDYPRVAAYVHAATHTYGANHSVKRPGKPPQCTASANHHNIYISHKKLTEWDVRWSSFEQFAGELVVLGPFVWAQYYWNESGVMEEGVYGNEVWKNQIVKKGLVTQCSAACGGSMTGNVDLKSL